MYMYLAVTLLKSLCISWIILLFLLLRLHFVVTSEVCQAVSYPPWLPLPLPTLELILVTETLRSTLIGHSLLYTHWTLFALYIDTALDNVQYFLFPQEWLGIIVKYNRNLELLRENGMNPERPMISLTIII